ncbi:hypothetical protein ACFPTO_02125 [Paraburkholderia denitrificans]|uniref:Uncharacterized protein n=1 Tax=Paraburkholderia denitrificans TaxID=694025 RepID=A0ABW0J3J8_9BURK
MSKKIVSDADWIDARRQHEVEGVSLGKLSQLLECSKTLVAIKAKEQGWVKARPGGPAANGNGAKQFVIDTESAVQEEARAVHLHGPSSPASTSQPAVATTAAMSAPVTLPALPDKPVFANWAEEADWVEKQVAEQQNALMSRHALELKYMTAAINDGLKKIGKQGVGEAARAANALAQAMTRKHKLELDHLAEWTRIRLGVYRGDTGPRPCIIVVHQREGVAFGKLNDAASVDARVRDARLAIARKIVAEAGAAREQSVVPKGV